MAYDAERQRINDHLDTVLPSGRTVREAVHEGLRRRREEEALRRAMNYSGGASVLDRLARLFTAGHGR